jgi:hypothetical protein
VTSLHSTLSHAALSAAGIVALRYIPPVPNVARPAQARFLAGLASVEDAMIALIDLRGLLSAAHEVTEQ